MRQIPTTQLFLLASAVYAAVLALVTFFTRATWRRFLGSVAGGLAVALVGVGVEFLAQTYGWWRYPFTESPYGPLLIYPVIIVAWMVYSLIGWRVMRRFGRRGEVVFLVAVTALGTFRDYFEARRMLGFIVFAPGFATVLIDALCWAGLTALAQVVMFLVAGPAGADSLGRLPKAA